MKNLPFITACCFLCLGSFLNGCARQSRVDGFFDGSSPSRPDHSRRRLTRVRESSPAPSARRPARQPAAPPASTNSIPAQSDRSTTPNIKLVGWSQNPSADNPRSYTVKKGDSLFAIARKFYGGADAWKLIYQANQGIIADPENLPAGVELQIP